MKNKRLFFVVVVLVFLFLPLNINASAVDGCTGSSASECTKKSSGGYKCKWDSNKKGGARCYKSKELTDEKKETITSCSQIKESSTCQASQVDGFECIWRQGACFSATDDGSGETIIANDEDDRQKQEDEKKDNNTNTPVEKNEYQEFVFCDEDGVLKTFQIVSYLIMIIKILVPLLLIIFGSIDLGKAVIAGDDKAIQAASKMLVTRAIGGIIIFFIPTIINFAVGLVASWSSVENEFKNCQTCLDSASECITKRKEICSKKYSDRTCTWDDQLGACNCVEK